MELIKYRKTLDVHKNGIQFMLQGFETADKLSRVIEISLMASGDAIDFPLDDVEALMYVTTPNATKPSINKCTIKDNKVVYDVLPIVEEGITKMQLKIISASTEGAKSVIASPKFSVEVTKSDADDESAMQTTTFTSLEDATAKAKSVYDKRFLRMELTNDCVFKAYYADGTVYETDLLKKLFYNGNVELSESYAHGGTGVRAGEDTDNSKYYSTLAHSEALTARDMVEDGKEILEETKLHGVYTAFSVDFTTGEVEYVSPSFAFKINAESGELDAIGQSYAFNDEVGRVVDEWLLDNSKIDGLIRDISKHNEDISAINEDIYEINNRTLDIEHGGTGASTSEEARANLDAEQKSFEVKITTDSKIYNLPSNSCSTETTYEEILEAIESGKRVFARFYKNDGTRLYEYEYPLIRTTKDGCLFIGSTDHHSNHYAMDYSEGILGRLFYIEIGADSSVTVNQKPLGGACVAHGSYTGTGEVTVNADGTYSYAGVGKDEPNTLAFDFKPKLIYIYHNNTTLILAKHTTEAEGAPDQSNYASFATFYNSSGEITTKKNIEIIKTFDGRYVSWYAETTNSLADEQALPLYQMNQQGWLYDYIAIG